MNAIVLTALWGVLMMFSGVFVKSKTAPKYIAIAGILVVLVANLLEQNILNLNSGPLQFYIDSRQMLDVKSYNLAFLSVVFLSALIFFLLSGRDVERTGEHSAEYFALIFFVLCGVSLCATFNTLLLLFLGIEIMSIPLYILTGSEKKNLKSIEAALKYFLMGSFSTGIMLMGIAFIYGGNPNASFYITNLQLGVGALTPMLATGIVFMVIALGFKVSAAPFHFWTADVYEGAPTAFTSFMSTIVKVAGFFAFLRLFENSFGRVHAQWQNLIVFITVLTLLIGNITAVFQQSVKRMLAYSSIAQAGFMLLAIFALNDLAKQGLILYSFAYCIAAIGFFAILMRMKDYTVEGFRGLAKHEPLVAFCGTIFLLSLTGIPLTAGFQAKFYLLMAAAAAGTKFWLVIVAVIFAAISAYYYFRVIQAIYFKASVTDQPAEPMSRSYKSLLLITALLIILAGIFPELVIGWIYR